MKPLRFALVPVTLVLVLVLSCAPKAPAQAPPAVAAPASVLTTPPQPVTPVAKSLPLSATEPATTSAQAPVRVAPVVVRAFDESLLRGREFLLEASAAPLWVRDTDLGIVGQDPEVTKAVEAFFRVADDGALVPRWRDYLQAWSKRFQASGGVGERTITVGQGLIGESGVLMVPVKLSGGEEPPLQGWMALVKEEQLWLVSDIQVVEGDPRATPFDPETATQEISSPNRR